VTQTPSTHRPVDTYYAIMADGLDRDPVVTNVNRATVPLGRGFKSWQRCNPTIQLVWVDDADGTPRALTPKQAQVLALALEMIDGAGLTMRQMAETLRVAPSTVSRALTKLASWGLIAYVVGRGRWAGLVIFRRAKGDGMERFRETAKARVRRWSQAVQERISRSRFNVASRVLDRERGKDSLYYYFRNSMDATLAEKPLKAWGWEEIEEALR